MPGFGYIPFSSSPTFQVVALACPRKAPAGACLVPSLLPKLPGTLSLYRDDGIQNTSSRLAQVTVLPNLSRETQEAK